MNGAPGAVVVGRSSRRATTNSAARSRTRAASAASAFPGRKAVPPSRCTANRCPSSSPGRARSAKPSQYSSGTNARISRSRSTMRRTATDCTRPAERPRAILAHSSGESSKPTTRSRNRRACWALTRFSSIRPGFRKAASIADWVISLKTTRRKRSGSPPISSCRCQAIASPSRSRSVARYTCSDPSARRLSSETTLSLPGRTSYSASQPLSGSTPMRRTSCARARRRLCSAFLAGDSLRVRAASRARSRLSVRLAAHRQVAHVADAGFDDVVLAQIPVDRPRLRWRLDDH